ncbi:MAG: hypothetical protein K6U00_02855, partial [Armatimonadetes bacterium]|nr:hypothetical protein [Armatimonadota bacterium]
INVLVRRQWQDRERLPFPVVQLPLEMTDPAGRLFRNRLMWIGFSVAAGLDLLNGLNYLYPNIPVLIQTRAYDLAPLITQKPWNAMGRASLPTAHTFSYPSTAVGFSGSSF